MSWWKLVEAKREKIRAFKWLFPSTQSAVEKDLLESFLLSVHQNTETTGPGMRKMIVMLERAWNAGEVECLVEDIVYSFSLEQRKKFRGEMEQESPNSPCLQGRCRCH